MSDWGANQKACSLCHVRFTRGTTSVWCCYCGYLHVDCSGLETADRWKKGFSCKNCPQTSSQGILPQQLPDIDPVSSGLTQAMRNLDLGPHDSQASSSTGLTQAFSDMSVSSQHSTDSAPSLPTKTKCRCEKCPGRGKNAARVTCCSCQSWFHCSCLKISINSIDHSVYKCRSCLSPDNSSGLTQAFSNMFVSSPDTTPPEPSVTPEFSVPLPSLISSRLTRTCLDVYPRAVGKTWQSCCQSFSTPSWRMPRG